MEKQFITIQEAANVFFDRKISAATLYRLISIGELQAIKIGKKYLLNIAMLQQKYG